MIWLILIACLLGMVSGTREAMIFIQPRDIMYDHWEYSSGVRCHRWFGLYHTYRILEFISIMAFTILLPEDLTFRNFLIIGGSLFLMWEFFEIAYAYSRWNTFLSHEENIDLDFISWRLKPYATVAIHIIRIIAGISLITWSMI